MKRRYCLLILSAGLAQAQLPPSHPLFDADAVHEIRLRFQQADWWEQLTANYESDPDNVPYIQASFELGSYKYDVVGVRFKGNSSYNGANTKKKPFRIKLNEFVKGQKIKGMASFGLSNAWGDPSFVREKPYYELAAATGLKSPRSNFAALYINDTYWGLYVLGEIISGDFLTNHFGKGEDTGNLYKGNIGASFAYLGEDPTAYKEVWEKQSNEDADDWTDLIALAKVIDQTPVEELRAALDPLMDVDSVLTALAIDNLTANLDSYVGMCQNFNIYRRPSDGRWEWLPWDPSLAFGGLSLGQSVQQMKEFSLEWVTTSGGFPGSPDAAGGGAATRPLATKLWAIPEYKARYREIYRGLVESAFFPEAVVARMNTLRDMIRPWVEQDTQKLVTMEQFEQAMTADLNLGGGGAPGGPANPPDNPGPPPGDPPTNPPNPPTNPPANPPVNPGNPGGGGQGAVPGLQPFIEARVDSVKAQLAGN